MSLDPTQNFTIVEVSGTHSDTDTSVSLVSGEGSKLPDPSTEGEYNLVWWDSANYSSPAADPNVEIIRVTGISTDTLTVSRGQENTSASTKNTSDGEYVMALTLTAKTIQDIDSNLSSGNTVEMGTILINGTGDYNVTGLPFEPSRIEFKAAIPVDGSDVTLTGSGNEDGFSGPMFGFAVNGGSQQAIYSGGSGNSINNIRAGSKSGQAVFVEYADANGSQIAEIQASVSSFNSDGFTLNCGTYSSVANVSGLFVIYTAYK